MAFGEILRNARVQRGLSPSDVAENTHLLVQVVEDLEREDFRRVAAPIYGRGFVKLYAELLELDPEPLIREFMDLYAGARAPAVRTKKVEGQAEPQPESVPVTRTVTGTSPALPQRQPVQPRPAVAVRPLSTPQQPQPPEETAAGAAVAGRREEPQAEVGEAPAGRAKPEPVAQVLEPARLSLVVEPEEAEGEPDEPDLFHPAQQPRRSAAPGEAGREAGDKPAPARRAKPPVFKIGGRMEDAGEPAVQDAEAHARRRARIQAFVDGFTALKEGVESKLPSALPHKRLLVLGGAGVAVLVCMAFGIRVLFKLTGQNVQETPSPVFEVVAPPPDLYVD